MAVSAEMKKHDDISARSGQSGYRPRVLYVLPRKDFFAEGRRGRVVHALGVASGMKENGVSVTVLSGRGMADHIPKGDDAISAISVDEGNGTRPWFSLLVDRIRELLFSPSRPDVVIVRYAASKGFRFRSLMREFPDVVWCFEVNSLGSHMLRGVPSAMLHVVKYLECQVIAKADLIYVVSQQLSRDMSRYLRARGKSKIAVIPNGGPKPYDAKYSNNQVVRYYYLGMFHDYYELELVVDAFSTLSKAGLQAELHLYGDGRGMNNLKRATAGCNGITLHGRYAIDELLQRHALSENGILILPLRHGLHNSPIKLFEYMALGLPIISSNVGQLRDILRDGETGILYEAGSAASLATAMKRLGEDAFLRRKIAANARAEYPRHTWKERMADLLAALKTHHERKTGKI